MSQLGLIRAGKVGGLIIPKAVLSFVGLFAQCCRNRRPKGRPGAVRDVLQNQTRRFTEPKWGWLAKRRV